eukprot:m.53267 g.53267  ORF g.53267 m.53267 type:complete len:223 (+) comp13146_c0_seq1:143-811(+)
MAATATQQEQKTEEVAYPLMPSKKHPLERRWTLWFDNPQFSGKKDQKNWASNLEKIYTFANVEDFWAVFNNMEQAAEIPNGANYHFFQEGVQPVWEDPINQPGGKWVAQINRSATKELNTMWLNTLLLLIGEQFDQHNDEVVGAVISVRQKSDKLAVWTKNANSKEACLSIGRKFQGTIGARDIGYQPHRDAMKRGSSFANNNRYELKESDLTEWRAAHPNK